MPSLACIPSPRRPELVLNPLGDRGQHVVKDPATGAFYNLGPQEAFHIGQQEQDAPQVV